MASPTGFLTDLCKTRLPCMVPTGRAGAGIARQSSLDTQSSSRILQMSTYKKRMLEMWDKRAQKYDAADTFHEQLALKLVDSARLHPGQRVLDLATGTGMVAIPAARLVGDAGEVTGIDISAEMVAERDMDIIQAQKKAATAGLAQLRFMHGDVEDAEIPPQNMDTIFCSSAMLYFADIDSVLKRCCSWLKPGGSFYFNTPQEPCVPATLVFYTLLQDHLGVHLADAAEPLANASVVRKRCIQNGFQDVQVRESEEFIHFKGLGAREYADRIWNSLAKDAIMTPLDGAVAAEDLDRLKPVYMDRVEQLAEAWVSKDGVANPYTMLWVQASR